MDFTTRLVAAPLKERGRQPSSRNNSSACQLTHS